MATDAKCGCGAGNFDGLVRCVGPGHEGGAGDEAGLMEFEDASIDPGGQPEVVSIDDKSEHEGSLAVALALVEWVQTAICGGWGG